MWDHPNVGCTTSTKAGEGWPLGGPDDEHDGRALTPTSHQNVLSHATPRAAPKNVHDNGRASTIKPDGGCVGHAGESGCTQVSFVNHGPIVHARFHIELRILVAAFIDPALPHVRVQREVLPKRLTRPARCEEAGATRRALAARATAALWRSSRTWRPHGRHRREHGAAPSCARRYPRGGDEVRTAPHTPGTAPLRPPSFSEIPCFGLFSKILSFPQ